MMAAVKEARHGVLAPLLNPRHVAIGSINSPMQCMMKEVCAQCLQKHTDPKTGKETLVFSCFNQDQELDAVDFKHLNDAPPRQLDAGEARERVARSPAREEPRDPPDSDRLTTTGHRSRSACGPLVGAIRALRRLVVGWASLASTAARGPCSTELLPRGAVSPRYRPTNETPAVGDPLDEPECACTRDLALERGPLSETEVREPRAAVVVVDAEPFLLAVHDHVELVDELIEETNVAVYSTPSTLNVMCVLEPRDTLSTGRSTMRARVP